MHISHVCCNETFDFKNFRAQVAEKRFWMQMNDIDVISKSYAICIFWPALVADMRAAMVESYICAGMISLYGFQ